MRAAKFLILGLIVVLTLGLPPQVAAAQERPPSNCLALAMGTAAPRPVPVRFGDNIEEGAVLVRYLDHATFAIVTDDGKIAVTDYTGFIGNPDVVPDIVTMNNAHSTHFTSDPDPRIPHVLFGWGPPGVPPQIQLDLGSIAVRNVTSDLRGPFGEGARRDGNSIFLFEVAGLCIAHLGHLHQILSDEQLWAIGRVDVVMVPVDGAFTMDPKDMADTVQALGARVVLPMHWFSQEGLNAFLAELRDDFRIEFLKTADLMLSRTTLSTERRIIVLSPAYIP